MDDCMSSSASQRSAYDDEGGEGEIRIVCYGSSSRRTPPAYIKAAERFGWLLAKEGCICVHGGGCSGTMGALSRGCDKYVLSMNSSSSSSSSSTASAASAAATTSSPSSSICSFSDGTGVVDIVTHEGLPDGTFLTHDVSPSLRSIHIAKGCDFAERKQKLLEHAFGAVVFPGGCGTSDELWDLGCQLGLGRIKQRGSKEALSRLVLVNIDGFYAGTIMQLERMEKDGLLHRPWRDFVAVANTPEKALQLVLSSSS